MAKHPFQVGETYRNMKGEYEVIGIEGSTMEIRWADGSTWEGSIELQARILVRLATEEEARRLRALRPKRSAASRADTRGRTFSGLVDGDFQASIGGTSWRRRESLGGLLAIRLSGDAPGEFQSYPVPRQPAVHVARPSNYDNQNKWRQPKFVIMLDEEKASYGFYIEKSDEAMDDTWHWPKFLAALEGGPELRQRVESAMVKSGLDWRVWLQPTPGLAARVSVSGAKLVWTPVADGEAEELTWEGFVERLRAIADDTWCDLHLAADLPKAEAIGAGVGVADRIVEVFRALVPLYDASLK